MPQDASDLLLRIAELEIVADMLDAYKALLAEEIHASVGIEPGVLFLYGVSEKNTPTKIKVFECYANQQAYEHHITTPHFIKYKTLTAAMVKSLTLIDLDAIALAAK
jgi:quinol monooxygenase YgiN